MSEDEAIEDIKAIEAKHSGDYEAIESLTLETIKQFLGANGFTKLTAFLDGE